MRRPERKLAHESPRFGNQVRAQRRSLRCLQSIEVHAPHVGSLGPRRFAAKRVSDELRQRPKRIPAPMQREDAKRPGARQENQSRRLPARRGHLRDQTADAVPNEDWSADLARRLDHVSCDFPDAHAVERSMVGAGVVMPQPHGVRGVAIRREIRPHTPPHVRAAPQTVDQHQPRRGAKVFRQPSQRSERSNADHFLPGRWLKEVGRAGRQPMAPAGACTAAASAASRRICPASSMS